MVGSIFPVLSKQYWYFTAYTGAFMFFPILNLALEENGKETNKKNITGYDGDVLFVFYDISNNIQKRYFYIE